MKNKIRKFEVCTPEGKVILVLNLYERDFETKDNQENRGSGRTEKQKTQTGSKNSENTLMTTAQKRYLFRILTEKGIETEAAHDRLIELFQVDSLKEVTKFEASKMIEKLLEESKGEAVDPIPF